MVINEGSLVTIFIESVLEFNNVAQELKIKLITVRRIVVFIMVGNVRRYVALAQNRGGACFCTRGAIQGYDGY